MSLCHLLCGLSLNNTSSFPSFIFLLSSRVLRCRGTMTKFVVTILPSFTISPILSSYLLTLLNNSLYVPLCARASLYFHPVFSLGTSSPFWLLRKSWKNRPVFDVVLYLRIAHVVKSLRELPFEREHWGEQLAISITLPLCVIKHNL